MHITMVRKIPDPTSTCYKCDEVLERLESLDLLSQIDRVLFIDPNAAKPSEGSLLASRFEITKAPFFIVENQGQQIPYLSVMKLIRQVLQPSGQVPRKRRPEQEAPQSNSQP